MKTVLIPMAVFRTGSTAKVAMHMTRETYIKKLVKYGLMPLFVSTLMTPEMIDYLYDRAGGVLLTGGSDIDPAAYGAVKHKATSPRETDRDQLEIMLVKRTLEDRKPYLGICRGCQVLAVACGGSLCQHIPDRYDDHAGMAESYDELLSDKRHAISIMAGSKTFTLLNTDKLQVNSGHHQSVDRPGSGLKVAATSPAGVTEIIEHEDDSYYCFGIQSHPEAMEDSPMDRFFAAFAESIKPR